VKENRFFELKMEGGVGKEKLRVGDSGNGDLLREKGRKKQDD